MADREHLLEECIAYFRGRQVYERLFEAVWEKYRSLGHLGGSVTLTGLTEEDAGQLGGFLQKNYAGKRIVTISASALTHALADSRFAALTWEEILQAYFGRPLVSKSRQKQQELSKKEAFFGEILEATKEHPGKEWLRECLRTQDEGRVLLMKNYRENPRGLGCVLRKVLDAIPKLPFLQGEGQPKELVAVFAARTTMDPHFFDAGTLGEQLLMAFLRYELPEAAAHGSQSAEEKAALLYRAGLLKDALSNDVMVYGIRALTLDGRCHEGIEGFTARHEPMKLTLMTLGNLKKVLTSGCKIVYIVENPAVFFTLIGAWQDEVIVCGNGQMRLAALVLLDLFDCETHFFYAGDFDPEGLVIAQRLHQRYEGRVHMWNYRRSYYDRYKSDVKLSEKRLKKLGKIELPELAEIREALLSDRRAAYQEAMLSEYLTDKPVPGRE